MKWWRKPSLKYNPLRDSRPCFRPIFSDGAGRGLITGGTGLTEGDQAPEALLPLFDREVEGFGEVFRMLSFEEIGTATSAVARVAGVANNTLISPCRAPQKRAEPHGRISLRCSWMPVHAHVISISHLAK